MMMYKINWHEINGVFTHCTVDELTVLRLSQSHEFSSLSIIVADKYGKKFIDSPSNYYATADAAWAAAKSEIVKGVAAREQQLIELQAQIDAHRKYLATLFVQNLNTKCALPA